MLKAQYFPRGSVLDANIPVGCSFTWRSIASAIPILGTGVRWCVGNETNIRVWRDAWIPRDSFFHYIRWNSETPADLLLADLITVGRQWNDALIMDICTEEDATLISVPLFENDLPDRLVWSSSSSGMYMVKEGFYMARRMLKNLHEIRSNGGLLSGTSDNWNFLWNSKIPGKVKICVWRLVKGAVPVEG